VGGSDSHELTVSNSGIIPVHVYFESPTRELEFEPSRLSVGPRATESVTVTVSAPDKTGHFELFFHEHRYLAVLPKPVVTELFEVHPLAPLVAVDVLLGGSVFALGSVVFGTNRVRFRTPERPSGRFSLKKLVKYLYR
jgi:signal peptidase